MSQIYCKHTISREKKLEFLWFCFGRLLKKKSSLTWSVSNHAFITLLLYLAGIMLDEIVSGRENDEVL